MADAYDIDEDIWCEHLMWFMTDKEQAIFSRASNYFYFLADSQAPCNQWKNKHYNAISKQHKLLLIAKKRLHKKIAKGKFIKSVALNYRIRMDSVLHHVLKLRAQEAFSEHLVNIIMKTASQDRVQTSFHFIFP